jgi:hypothetical protein
MVWLNGSGYSFAIIAHLRKTASVPSASEPLSTEKHPRRGLEQVLGSVELLF